MVFLVANSQNAHEQCVAQEDDDFASTTYMWYKLKLYATRNSLWYRSKALRAFSCWVIYSERTLVCNYAIKLRCYCKWGKIHYIKIAESESEAQTCWLVIYRRDVYRSIRDTEHLSTSFQSLGSPKHTCLELRPGAGSVVNLLPHCDSQTHDRKLGSTWNPLIQITCQVRVSAGVHIY